MTTRRDGLVLALSVAVLGLWLAQPRRWRSAPKRVGRHRADRLDSYAEQRYGECLRAMTDRMAPHYAAQ